MLLDVFCRYKQNATLCWRKEQFYMQCSAVHQPLISRFVCHFVSILFKKKKKKVKVASHTAGLWLEPCPWNKKKLFILIDFKPILNSQWSLSSRHRSQLTSAKVLVIKEKMGYIDIWQCLLSTDTPTHIWGLSSSVSQFLPVCCDITSALMLYVL